MHQLSFKSINLINNQVSCLEGEWSQTLQMLVPYVYNDCKYHSLIALPNTGMIIKLGLFLLCFRQHLFKNTFLGAKEISQNGRCFARIRRTLWVRNARCIIHVSTCRYNVSCKCSCIFEWHECWHGRFLWRSLMPVHRHDEYIHEYRIKYCWYDDVNPPLKK